MSRRLRHRSIAAVAAVAALLAAVPPAAAAPSLPTVEEALRAAFPGAEPERETVFLTRDERRRAEETAGVTVRSRLVTRYVLRRDGEVVGWAYLDTHRVRTLPETLLVMLTADGTVRRVEVVAFREPREYLPPASWYRQLDGAGLGRELALGRRVRPVTGATLSARAAVAATRRVLAIHAVLAGGERR